MNLVRWASKWTIRLAITAGIIALAMFAKRGFVGNTPESVQKHHYGYGTNG